MSKVKLIEQKDDRYAFIRYIPGPNSLEDTKGLLDALYHGDFVPKTESFSYIVTITKEDIEYIFSIKARYCEYLKDKIKHHYPEGEVIIISEEDSEKYSLFLNNYTDRASLVTKMHDACSLNTKSELPLTFHSIKNQLNDDEYVGLIIPFNGLPRNYWDKMMKHFETAVSEGDEDFLIRKYKNKTSFFASVFSSVYYLVPNGIIFMGSLISTKKSKNKKPVKDVDIRHDFSFEKKYENILRSNINVISKGSTECRSVMLLENVISSLKNFNSTDNILVKSYKKNKKSPVDFTIKEHLRLSTSELKGFLSIPNEALKSNGISHIRYHQVKLPKSISSGEGYFLGYNNYRGENQLFFKVPDGNITYIIGPENSGKTNLQNSLSISLLLNKQGYLHVDGEDDLGFTKINIEVLDKLKKKYILFDYSKKGFSTDNQNAIIYRKTSFNSFEEVPPYVKNTSQRLEWLRDSVDRDYAILESTIYDINSEGFTVDENVVLKSALLLTKVVNIKATLKDAFDLIANTEKRDNFLKQLEVGRENELFEYFIGDQNILDEYTRILHLKDSDKFGNISFCQKILKTKDFYMFWSDTKENIYNSNVNNEDYQSNENDELTEEVSIDDVDTIDFREYIKEGIPVLVAIPEGSSENLRNAMSMYFYNKVFYASSYFMAEKAIPFSLFIDEIDRYPASFEFMHKVLNTLRRHKLSTFVTINNLNKIAKTAFEGDFAKSKFSCYVLSDTTEDVFNVIKHRLSSEFQYSRDIIAINDMSTNGKRYGLYSSSTDGSNGTFSCILELPPILNSDTIDDYLIEMKNLARINMKKTFSGVLKIAEDIMKQSECEEVSEKKFFKIIRNDK